MQEIRLEGIIGQDAQVKQTQSGKQYGMFSVGCSEKTGKKLPDGKDEYQTMWYDVFCQSEQVQYLTKGKRVLVIGKPSYRAYISKKDNQPMVACSVQFTTIYLEIPRTRQNQGTSNTAQQPPIAQSPEPNSMQAQQQMMNNPNVQQLQQNFGGQVQYQAPPQQNEWGNESELPF